MSAQDIYDYACSLHSHNIYSVNLIATLQNELLCLASSRNERSILTRFLCSSRTTVTIVVTRAQRARAPQAPPPQGNMNQGQ